METTTGSLTQSKFFSPAFNAAIFDGPFKIYFAQYQEPIALNLYFKLQSEFKKFSKPSSLSGKTIFIMLYPNSETFHLSFENKTMEGDFIEAGFDEDIVFGVKEISDGFDFSGLLNKIRSKFNDILSVNSPAQESLASL